MHSIEPVPLPHDGPPDISLWRVDVDFNASLDSATFASLSDDERERARAFRRHEDALRFATVRAALREQLARRLSIAPRALRFMLDANRRPRLVELARPDFNVSHAGAHGLIAMSSQRHVGVDIEQHSERFDWRSIVKLTLDPGETAWIETLEASRQAAAFYDAWVAKEALVKTTGVGIARGLQHLTVLPREGVSAALRDPIPDDMLEVTAQWIAVPQAYAACLAWSLVTFNG